VSRPITIVEVGPRDGLQNEKAILEPAVRAELVHRLEAAGARRIEAVSFVHPKYVPQMAGAEEVMAALPHAAGRSRIGLVLNGKGYDRALGTAVDEVNVAMSATDGFGLKNQGLSVDQQVQMLADIIAGRANAAPPPPSAVPLPRSGGGNGQPGATPALSATLSCVWGCPFDGEVSDGQVADLVGRIAELGVAEIALADTIGAGDPWAVTKKVEAARAAAPDAVLRLHFHDTRNTGLANAFAGIEAGVSVLDASVGGIGGCPFAPGATGNIATEDLVYMLERAGYSTGYDLDALIFATGYDAVTGPLLAMNVRGKSGLRLADKWADGPKVYLGLVTSGFPNLFIVTGPGSPSVKGNMVHSIEQHVNFIADCLAYLRNNKLNMIDSDLEAEERWSEHVREVAERTLFPLADSWYVGANIPGKPRVFLPYVGGIPAYRKTCERVVANGYEGFHLQ
jgi:hydroxymethylglutaryl-CoA lyase